MARRTPEQELCDHQRTTTDYIERPDGQHKIVVCSECKLILEDCGYPEADNVE